MTLHRYLEKDNAATCRDAGLKFLADSYRSTIPLLFSPDQVALGALFLSTLQIDVDPIVANNKSEVTWLGMHYFSMECCYLEGIHTCLIPVQFSAIVYNFFVADSVRPFYGLHVLVFSILLYIVSIYIELLESVISEDCLNDVCNRMLDVYECEENVVDPELTRRLRSRLEASRHAKPSPNCIASSPNMGTYSSCSLLMIMCMVFLTSMFNVFTGTPKVEYWNSEAENYDSYLYEDEPIAPPRQVIVSKVNPRSTASISSSSSSSSSAIPDHVSAPKHYPDISYPSPQVPPPPPPDSPW